MLDKSLFLRVLRLTDALFASYSAGDADTPRENQVQSGNPLQKLNPGLEFSVRRLHVDRKAFQEGADP
jgi:hypothetical protein